MIALGVADLVIIAGRTLALDTGAVLELLDPAAAERALAQAGPGAAPGDPARRAALVLTALVRERPLRRGNQQVALAAMLQFLALNGWDVDLDPPGTVRSVVAEVTAGHVGAADVADWLAPRLRPDDPGAPRRGEAPMRERPVRVAVKVEQLRQATMRMQPTGAFRRFTDRARQVVCLAVEEARLRRHHEVGPEHLLLGLLFEGEGVAAMVLEAAGISLEDARARIDEIIGKGQDPATGNIPFTPQGKRTLERSLREALSLGQLYIGTEHLLLALMAEGDGAVARVLAGLGAEYAQIRDRVLGFCRPSPGGSARMFGVTVPADLVDTEERLAQLRRRKDAALDAGDLEAAAALRDRERQLRTSKAKLERLLTAGEDFRGAIAENQRMREEVNRLRALLRQHGIEPGEGTAQTA